ncbi:MAG: 2-amino-4-hydroxy-6-hydroxymethyldihydropteridine diphosphokinase [Bacteroidota bacterium]|nr:2-amino-4-hydroxy-6-hydroxymethyldihydropteridine diphosphokinase [Bacteroidota bacterium]
MNGIFLLLGTNQGNRTQNLNRAVHLLNTKGIDVQKKSYIYESAPWGVEDQPSFLNQALQINTILSAEELLSSIKNIEVVMGRVNTIKWGERLIDIDILYYHDLIIKKEDLIVPHPQIPNRRFTLVPLVEIAPYLIHPELQMTQQELLQDCNDKLQVKVAPKGLV